jgi:hypothetical protein
MATYNPTSMATENNPTTVLTWQPNKLSVHAHPKTNQFHGMTSKEHFFTWQLKKLTTKYLFGNHSFHYMAT